MRELLSYAVDPEIISLAGGLPASEALPVADFQRSMQAVLERDGAAALQYSPQYGPLREWLAEHMRARGVPCNSEQVFITNGAQQGLAILSRLLLEAGQAAVVEAVTFTGVKQVTVGRGAEVRAVAIDPRDGVDLTGLEEAFSRAPRPSLAVLIPEFHNPLSACLTADRRARVAALAAEYAVPLIEDDPYAALRIEGQSPPPIKAYDEAGFVFYVGSFSKMLAPAVRLGWIVAPPEVLDQIIVLRESLDLESSTLIQRAVEFFLREGLHISHLARLREIHRERRDELLRALATHFDGLGEWTRPEGGLFVWLTLGPDIDTWELFPAAVERKVAYIPGAAFAIEKGHQNCLRLSFGNADPEKIEEGVARLAEVVRRAIP